MGNILVIPNSDFSENCLEIPTVTVETINGQGWMLNLNCGWEASTCDAEGNIPAQTGEGHFCFVFKDVDEEHPGLMKQIAFPEGASDMTGILEQIQTTCNFMIGSRCGNGDWPYDFGLDSPDNIYIKTWSCNTAFGNYFKNTLHNENQYMFKNLYNCEYLDLRGLLPWLNSLSTWPFICHQMKDDKTYVDVSGFVAKDNFKFSSDTECILGIKAMIVNDCDSNTINKLITELNKSPLRTNWDLHTSSKYGTIISSQDYID